MTAPFLAISGLSASYGRVSALRNVSLQMEAGQIVAVLGANGAGKSTLLQTILGAVRPTSGEIRFDGREMNGVSVHHRVAKGIVLVPEGRRVLISMTIDENLLLGAHFRRDVGAVRSEIDAIYDRFPNLATCKDQLASRLSGGEQQMLAIGRALLTRPRLLMLDEPSLGLSPLFIDKVFELLVELNRAGQSILLVEQNTAKALKISHHAVVLELGQVTLEGSPELLLRDERLQEAYLGKNPNPNQNAKSIIHSPT